MDFFDFFELGPKNALVSYIIYYFSSLATSPQFVIKESLSSPKLILSEDWTLFNKIGSTIFKKRLLSVTCFSFSFAK